MPNNTILSKQGNGYYVFINLVDNRIFIRLDSVSSEEMRELKKFIISKGKFLNKTFTSLLELTKFKPVDDGVEEEIKSIQEYLKSIGWSEHARVKKSNNIDLRYSNIMKDGFYTSLSAANNYLNTYRTNKAIN